MVSRYRIRPNYRTVHLGFFKITGKTCNKICIHLLKVKQDHQMAYLMVLMRCFVFVCVFFFFFFYILSKSICCGYSFELHRQLLKTTELLYCALLGVCAVIRSNTVNIMHMSQCPALPARLQVCPAKTTHAQSIFTVCVKVNPCPAEPGYTLPLQTV